MMPDYSQRLQEISDVRQRAIDECERQVRLIGERVLELPDKAIPDNAGPLIQRHRSIQERLESASSAIERLMEIDQRQDEIRERMKTLQKERDGLFRGLDSVYEQIGAVAFRLFKDHPLIDASYSQAFASLARYQDDIRVLDAQLDRYSVEPARQQRSVLERIGTSTRRALAKNRKSVRTNQLPRLLQDAGRRLMETDFVDQMDDDELSSVAKPIREVEERRAVIDTELQNLKDESGTLVAEFNSLGNGQKLSRARKERESEIEAAKSESGEILSSLGSVAVETPPESLTDQIDALKQCQERISHFDSLLERLKAGQKAVTVSNEISQAKERMSELRQELEELEQKTQAKEKELHQLESQRGNEDELFDT
jgi:DNA repair exonuclease SbcCD ATPase subunit